MLNFLIFLSLFFLFVNSHVFILFTAKPDISTDPFSPRTEIEPSKSNGLAAVVASMQPKEPFLNW